MQLRDSVFIVTGAASGLGAASAAMLAGAGARVVLADLQDAAGLALAEQLNALARAGRYGSAGATGQGGPEGLAGAHGDSDEPTDVVFVRADVCSESDAAAVIRQARALGPLRGLVNCAGVAPAASTLGREGPHAFDVFQRTVAINLFGSFNMARLAAEAMAKNPALNDGERGVIVNTASVAAYDGQVGQVAYAASKAAIVGMTLPMARDLARHGIRVMTIAPGIFETPMLLAMPAAVQQVLGQSVPFPQRPGRAAEFAQLVRSIIENVMLNGETIRLDGAIRMPPK